MSSAWKPVLITEPTDEGIRATCVSHETMLVAVLDAILERYESDPGYPFIDTKLNLITGEDFDPGDDPELDFKSKRVVFGWIQGRGLEALAGHADWLPECSILTGQQIRDRVDRLHRIIGGVLDTMETLRGRSHGRVPFMMSTDGQPLGISEDGRLEPIDLEPDVKSFGDMFYAKGLYAAALTLGVEQKVIEAETCFRDVADRIEAGGFVTDQQPFDPKNKVRPVPGRTHQGPRMIGLFGISLIAGATGSEEWMDRGSRFIRHILDHHVVRDPSDTLEICDFVEAVGEAGKPWLEPDGAILCDPGHALECVGAMARFLKVARDHDTDRVPPSLFERCSRILPAVLVHVFDLAWNSTGDGLCKSYNLVARRPHNDDMPWWNLPETIRAAALLLHLFPGMEHAPAVRSVLAKCSNAFLASYVNPDVHLMAYQTRNAQGQPIDVIPATPDADPGYHTGLAIIDFLRLYSTPETGSDG